MDDEPDNVALLTRILHQVYDVDSANSGPEALDKLRHQPVDIIITDQRMPGMTGAEFLAETLALAPEAIRIVVSAYSDFEAILDAINVAGASAFLRKPVSAGTLEAALSKALQAKTRAVEQSRAIAELEKQNQELQARLEDLEAKIAK